MSKKGKLGDRFALSADLLTETTPGTPIVEICGNKRVLIENHKGVTAYGESKVCVKVSYGVVCVHGTGLCLAQMTKHQLVITGCIDDLALQRGGS